MGLELPVVCGVRPHRILEEAVMGSIFLVFKVIHEMYSLLMSILGWRKEQQEKSELEKQQKLQEALNDVKKAQTEEELKNAQERAAKHLP